MKHFFLHATENSHNLISFSLFSFLHSQEKVNIRGRKISRTSRWSIKTKFQDKLKNFFTNLLIHWGRMTQIKIVWNKLKSLGKSHKFEFNLCGGKKKVWTQFRVLDCICLFFFWRNFATFFRPEACRCFFPWKNHFSYVPVHSFLLRYWRNCPREILLCDKTQNEDSEISNWIEQFYDRCVCHLFYATKDESKAAFTVEEEALQVPLKLFFTKTFSIFSNKFNFMFFDKTFPLRQDLQEKKTFLLHLPYLSECH